MIERLFVDNFRCFVNFEWTPGKLALLLGENGSGKTSIIDVVWGVRALIVEDEEVRRRFPSTSRTQWDSRMEQRIELDVRLGNDVYAYRLTIEHHAEEPARTRVKKESLSLAGAPLMDFTDGELLLYRDDGSAGSALSARWNRSGLGTLAPSKNNKKLIAFKRWFSEDVWCFRPDPRAMSSRTDEPGELLGRNLHDFASWYPSFIAQDLDAAVRVRESLKEALPGFETLGVDRARPHLQVRFKTGQGSSYGIDFGDLSDGQRALVALYVLRHAVLRPGRLVVFDEPDNYVALREIQPWLMEVIDEALTAQGPQIWFVSHHPELLNRLAPSHGTRFFRNAGSPVRTESFKGHPGLTPSETIAQGWSGQ